MKAPYLKFIFYFVFIATSMSVTSANEIRVQQSLINAAKDDFSELKDANVLVQKVEYFKEYAYLCAIGLDSTGNPIQSNEFISVYDMLMQRTGNEGWKQVANFNSFSLSKEKINCHISRGINSYLSRVHKSDDTCIPIDKGNSERKNILDTMRETKDQQFLVTRLCKTSSMAYFCGTSLDKKTKFINGTGNAINVSDVILRKEPNGKWKEIVELGNFALSPRAVTCLFGKENVVLNNDTLKNAANKLEGH